MRGPLYLITPPDEEVVTLNEAKSYLRQTTDDQDDLIQAMVDASVSALDPASNGWLGRALRPQTWEMRLPNFGQYQGLDGGYDRHGGFYRRMMDPEFHHGRYRYFSRIELPFPPLISVDSVKYDDGNGVEQTLTVDIDYRVFGASGIRHAYVEPPYNKAWPVSVRYDNESVRIRFTAGYPETGTGDPLPGTIKQAVLLMVKSLFDVSARNLFVSAETVQGVGSRSYVVTQNAADLMRSVSENLLQNLRVYE